MDAAAPELDLENGGTAAVEALLAYPADQRLKETQPFTWLGAAPYVAVFLAGLALFVAGVVIYDSGGLAAMAQGQEDSQQPYHMTTMEQVGAALLCTGTLIAALGIVAGCFAAEEGCCECNPRRFGPD